MPADLDLASLTNVIGIVDRPCREPQDLALEFGKGGKAWVGHGWLLRLLKRD